MGSPYTVFVVAALVIAGWLAVLALLTRGRAEPPPDEPVEPLILPPARPHG